MFLLCYTLIFETLINWDFVTLMLITPFQCFVSFHWELFTLLNWRFVLISLLCCYVFHNYFVTSLFLTCWSCYIVSPIKALSQKPSTQCWKESFCSCGSDMNKTITFAVLISFINQSISLRKQSICIWSSVCCKCSKTNCRLKSI